MATKKPTTTKTTKTSKARATNGSSNGNGASGVTGYGASRHAQPFPYWDRRRLVGEWTVEESVERIVNYRYAEQQISAALGGWVATIPELDVKAMFGPHCYQHAWACDLWRLRLPELRENNDDRSEPANADFAAFMKELTSPDDADLTVEKLVGTYRVLVPHLLATYTYHQKVTSDIADAPTVRILGFMLADLHTQFVEGEMMIQDLARTTKLRERAGKWQTHLDVMLAKSGGVAGEHTLGGRSKIVKPGKALLGAALREKLEATASS